MYMCVYIYSVCVWGGSCHKSRCCPTATTCQIYIVCVCVRHVKRAVVALLPPDVKRAPHTRKRII